MYVHRESQVEKRLDFLWLRHEQGKQLKIKRLDRNKVRRNCSARGCHLTASQARRRLSFFLDRKA